MPRVNYCKKCKAETPLGEVCPYCSAKLTQNGEQISFGLVRKPVADWFAWNQLLRIVLPVWLLIVVLVPGAEYMAAGTQGAISLLTGGFLRTMGLLLVSALGVIWLLLGLQGTESIHVVLDKQGVHMRTYVQRGKNVALYSRLMSEQSAEALGAMDERPELQGLVLVKRTSLQWGQIRRVRIWREDSTLLFYRPSLWLASAVRVPVQELAEAEAFVRQKMKRNKKAKILPA